MIEKGLTRILTGLYHKPLKQTLKLRERDRERERMGKAKEKEQLNRILGEHLNNIHETLQVLLYICTFVYIYICNWGMYVCMYVCLV